MRCVLLVCLLGVSTAAAQDRDAVRDLLPEGDSALDPIGTGDMHTLRDVPTPNPEPPVDPTLGVAPPTVASQRGEILWAIPGVREIDHRMSVRLVDGMAVVDVEMHFTSRARHRAEVRYRLMVPEDATPVSLEVCRDGRCRSGSPSDGHTYFDSVRASPSASPAAPIAHVAREGAALIVRAAPIARGAPTVVKLRWVAAAPLRGGVARLRIPARGSDLRAVAATVQLSAEGLLAPSLQDAPAGLAAIRVDPWVDVEVAGAAPSGGPTQLRIDTFPCAGQRCARVRASAGPRRGERANFVLLIDASPSTFGPARGRIAATLASLVASMPSGSTVRAIAFAGSAETLVGDAVAPPEFSLASVARATTLELGSATRLEAAWRTMRPWTTRSRNVHAIVVGDGGLTTGEDLNAAVRAARRAGLRLSVLNVADRDTSPELRAIAETLNGAVVDAGAAADEASRGRSTQRLEEALLPIFAPRVAAHVRVRFGTTRHDLGPLHAGEELTWEGPFQGRLIASAGGQRARSARHDPDRLWLQAPAGPLSAVDPVDLATPSRSDCHMWGPATRAGGVSSAASPIALAEPLTCSPTITAPTPAPELGHGVPAETLLSMLRTRIVPVARACFRRDRAGRTDYATRAVFQFRLADREIAQANVEGEISAELRACLLGAVDDLDVPRFDGAVVVRYPLYTERVARPARIEIHREVLDQVDRIAGDQPSVPSVE